MEILGFVFIAIYILLYDQAKCNIMNGKLKSSGSLVHLKNYNIIKI